jgi:hypothetical protein
MKNRHLAAVAVLVGGPLVIAGCSNPTAAPPTTTAIPVKYAKPIIDTTTVIAGQTITVPRENPATPISPYTATGNQVIITSTGVLPYHLFTGLGTKVTWTNLSTKTMSIHSIAPGLLDSGPIKPGQTFSWSSPSGISVRYLTNNGFVGRVDVGAFGF